MATRTKPVAAATKTRRRSAPRSLAGERPKLPPPSDEAVRVAAVLAVMREFELAVEAGQRLEIEQPVFTYDFDERHPAEQCLARLLVKGEDVDMIAGVIGISAAAVRQALYDLAAGARVEWSPKSAAKAVA